MTGDIEGKLDVLRVECRKCRRKGRYQVHKLIAKYGRKGNLMKWKEQLKATTYVKERMDRVPGFLSRGFVTGGGTMRVLTAGVAAAALALMGTVGAHAQIFVEPAAASSSRCAAARQPPGRSRRARSSPRESGGSAYS